MFEVRAASYKKLSSSWIPHEVKVVSIKLYRDHRVPTWCIARALGCSTKTICTIMRKAGVLRPRHFLKAVYLNTGVKYHPNVVLRKVGYFVRKGGRMLITTLGREYVARIKTVFQTCIAWMNFKRSGGYFDLDAVLAGQMPPWSELEKSRGDDPS